MMPFQSAYDHPHFRKWQPEPFRVTTSMSMKYRFRGEIEIFECEEATEIIRAHPNCPFYQFAFAGECQIDREWYTIAANGPVYEATTQVILLKK